MTAKNSPKRPEKDKAEEADQLNNEEAEDEDEVEFSPEPDESEAPQMERKLRKLREKVKQLKESKKQYVDELQRQKAEFLNARRRDEEKKQEDISLANQRLILELLPVVDSFEMAFADQESYQQTPENWRQGVEYIYSQLLSTLEGHGVQQLDPIGEVFDPRYHEAIEQTEVEEREQDGRVVKTVQKGYLLNGKVIRSAKVKVGRYHGEPTEEGSRSEESE